MYTTYQSTYFIDDFIQAIIKNPKIKVIQQVQQKINTKQVWTLEIACCYVILHLYLKRLGFTGEPLTQWTCQSHVNINHVRMWKEFIATSCHIMLHRIVSRFTSQPWCEPQKQNVVSVRRPKKLRLVCEHAWWPNYYWDLSAPQVFVEWQQFYPTNCF